MKMFNLDYQYQLYLKRVKCDETSMSPVQRVGTKRAFMGAWGQLLILLHDELTMLDDGKAVVVLEDMKTQVGAFWKEEGKLADG